MQKYLILFFTVITCTLLASSCSKAPGPVSLESSELEQIHLSIEGMTCEGCVKGITHGVESIEGVAGCEISLDDEKGTFSVVKGRVDAETLVNKINSLGFTAKAE